MKRLEYYATVAIAIGAIYWLIFVMTNINTLQLDKVQKEIVEQDVRIQILESKALLKDTIIINLNLNQPKNGN